jgi:hypothetical protein
LTFFQEVIFVKDMLYALVALVFLAVAFLSWWMYTASADNKFYLAGIVVFALLFIVFGGLFLSGRVNKNEDIHITE